MKTYKNALLVLICLFAAICCGAPTKDEVKTEFLKVHPNAVVVSIAPGEGDSGNVYMHIKYRLPGNNKEMEDEWLYQDLGGKKWENTWRKSTGHRKDRK